MIRPSPDRSDVFWWLYVVFLAGAALFIAYSFIGILVLGVFGYYATRPIRARFQTYVDSRQLTATLTVLTILVPVLVLTLYASIRALQQLQLLFNERIVSMLTERFAELDALQRIEETGLGSVLRDPASFGQLTDLLSMAVVQQGLRIVDAVFGTLILVALSVTLSYALLVYDTEISSGFARLVGGTDTAVYSYALAVDTDLESIFFGNFLFVLVMSVIATATYWVTNLIAPAGLAVPMVFTLGLLTGIASLIPIVVGKIIYLPVVAYLGVMAAQQGTGQLVFVGAVLVVYFLVLDIAPQSLIQPYITGRQLNAILLLFAYLLGPILFGWYGFFLLPIVFVLMLETIRIVLPGLLHGEPIDPVPTLARETGADVDEIHDAVPDTSDASTSHEKEGKREGGKEDENETETDTTDN